jgi:hypothetical protein
MGGFAWRGSVTQRSPMRLANVELPCFLNSAAFGTSILSHQEATTASFEQSSDGFANSVVAKSPAQPTRCLSPERFLGSPCPLTEDQPDDGGSEITDLNPQRNDQLGTDVPLFAQQP